LWYDIVRVTFDLVNTSNYRLIEMESGDFHRVQSFETAFCPICGEPLVLRGHCSRGVIFPDGGKVMLLIRRLRCPVCGRLHNELPDCLVPYKRLCAEVFESVITGTHAAAPCEVRTMRRILDWWGAVGEYFSCILKATCDKLKIPHPAVPAFRKTVRAAMNSNNWIFTDSICTRSVLVSG
jgi:predicted RNA-binding Zn-ribbon protein involved in translation (DUF1610 family)